MKHIVFNIICLLFCCNDAKSDISSQNTSIVLLHVMFRHGDRNPRINLGPLDPYKNASNWPGGFGALTDEGKLRMYRLGEYLRDKYGEFIGPYSEATVWVRSSDKSRTLNSAQCLLASLYPPQGGQIWNEDLLWNPIPVHTVPLKGDRLLNHDADCPVYFEEHNNYLNGSEAQELMKKNITKLKRFQKITAQTVVSTQQIAEFHDTVNIQMQHNMTPADWIYEFYPEWTRIFGCRYNNWTSTIRMKNIRCGPLFEEWQNHLRQLQSGTINDMRIFLYSTHDIVLSSLLDCLGYDSITQCWIPPFGSALIIEVHQDSSLEHYVRVLYLNGTESEPDILSPLGCDPGCPMETFLENLNTYIPESWDKECRLIAGEDNVYNTDYVPIALIGLAYLVFVIFTIVLVIRRIPVRRKYLHHSESLQLPLLYRNKQIKN